MNECFIIWDFAIIILQISYIQDTSFVKFRTKHATFILFFSLLVLGIWNYFAIMQTIKENQYSKIYFEDAKFDWSALFR